MRRSNGIKTFMLVLASLLLQVPTIYAQDDELTIHRQMIGVGSSSILDTYLSQEHYRGQEVRFIDHTIRPHSGKHWSTQLVHQAYVSYTSPRSDDNTDVAGMYSFGLSRHRNWTLDGGKLELRAGIEGMANLGFLYNMGNGNNPAQARLSATIGPNATAYYQFKLWQKAFRVRYEVGAPLLGVAFSPNFGQSYYEIFTRGNYDNNIKLTHPLNSPSLRQLLTLEFNLRKTTVSVGYLGDYQQADLNLIKYHNYSHMLVIGLVKRLQIKSFTL